MLTAVDVQLTPLTSTDIPQLTLLMAEAFNADARCLDGVGPELLQCYRTDDFFHKWPPGCIDTESFSITLGSELAGAAVIWRYPNHTAVLGLLFVAVPYQRYGIGGQIWRLIETRYDDIDYWLVAAPGWSDKTQRFYRNICGFRPLRREGAYVILEKTITR